MTVDLLSLPNLQLSSVPLKQRNAKIAMALAKLYHHFKNNR